MSKVLFAVLIAASLVAAMTMAPLLASAVSAITGASITTKGTTSLSAIIHTATNIAKNGKDGAFGYGVLTGGNSIMVSTTHAGVLDSAKQGEDASSPVWHNHYVQLTDQNVPTECAVNTALGVKLQVAALTFESPGRVTVTTNTISLLNMPATFSGTNALTGNPITLNPGTTGDTLVSFTLHPVFNGAGGALSNVCVENVAPFDTAP